MNVNPVGMILALALAASLSAAQGRSGSAPPTPPQRPPQSNAPATKPTPPGQAQAAAAGQMNATQHLAQQPQLTAQLQKLYPEMDLAVASADFKNLGAFVSTLHVSKNLTIPFDQLKAKVTGENAISLGKAIKELKPAVDADAEVKKAEAQAKADQDRAKGGGN